MTDLMTRVPAQTWPEYGRSFPFTLSYQVAARMANVALTAQVQIAYACAVAASESAGRAAACIERAWPRTPLRSLVVQAYRARASARKDAAREVLARARMRCGLAYARLGA
jgi:hypothetical protein